MPAPLLDTGMSLLEVRDEVVFTRNALQEDPEARDLAPRFAALLERWPAVLAGQLACWDAQQLCALRISLCDDVLDQEVKAFARDLLDANGGDRTAPHFEHYFAPGTPPSELVRPVLGDELETVRAWLPSLEQESDPKLSAYHARFAALVVHADAMVADSARADADNARFRNLGELAVYLKDIQTERDATFSIADRRVTKNPEKNLPRAWASGFFRTRRPAPLTEEERKAQAEKRAEARRKAEEVKQQRAEALQKIRDGKAALKALKKS